MLKRAFVNTLNSKLWTYLLLGGIGCPFALMQIGKTYFHMTVIQSLIASVILLSAFFFLRYIYFLLVEVIIFIHNTYVDSIWGKAIVDLKNAYSRIHYLRKQDKITDEEFMTTLVTFCNILKTIFDRKTKGNCCVSIKVPVGHFESLETWCLSNLCRDESHRNRDTEQYAETNHTVIGNTPYSVIVNNLLSSKQKVQPYYCNNDIEATKDYMNTSRNLHQKAQRYKSELVYAIVPIMGDHEYSHELLGFLCIDCDKRDAFDLTRYDIPMVEGIVDGIYDIIKTRTKNQ